MDERKYEVRAYDSKGLLIKRRWPVGEDCLRRTLNQMRDMGLVTAYDCYTPSLTKDKEGEENPRKIPSPDQFP
jgi:hypothetical protein